MKKKKIAVIGLKGLPAKGGAATVGENIILNLKEKYDFTVYLISSHTNKKTGNYYGYNQIVIKKIPIRSLNIFYYYLYSSLHCLFKEKYDLIHLHHADVALILLLLKLKYRVITTSHGAPDTNIKNRKNGFIMTRIFLFSEWVMGRLSDKITVVSIPLQKLYKKKLNRKIYYIPNGIKLDEKIDIIGATNLLNETGLKKKEYIVFSAGRIIPTKGCHFLLEALVKSGYKGESLIIGDLNQNLKYRKEILKLVKQTNTKMIGFVDTKSMLLGLLHYAKYYVFPSYFEAMSISLLETVCQNIPVICSDIDANRSLFSKDEVLFFETNNINDLSKKIDWALNNQELMIMKAKKAYEKLKMHYQWKDIVQKYEQNYLCLLK